MKYGKKLLIGTLLLTIFLVNMAAPASAYVYKGAYWHSGYAQYTRDSTIPSSWTTSLAAAANTWNNAGADFYFYSISCNNKLYYKSLGANGAVATTHPVCSGDSMVSCTVDFNSDKPWSTTGASNKIDVQSAATHEFGHWLRLGHSNNTEATMYETISRGNTSMRSLHSDDIAGICSIYP